MRFIEFRWIQISPVVKVAIRQGFILINVHSLFTSPLGIVHQDLVTEDDELWEAHSRQEFKDKKPGEDETWRELFIRLKYEREVKLKSITAHINRKSQKAAPGSIWKAESWGSTARRSLSRIQFANLSLFCLQSVLRNWHTSKPHRNRREESSELRRWMAPSSERPRIDSISRAPALRWAHRPFYHRPMVRPPRVSFLLTIIFLFWALLSLSKPIDD